MIKIRLLNTFGEVISAWTKDEIGAYAYLSNKKAKSIALLIENGRTYECLVSKDQNFLVSRETNKNDKEFVSTEYEKTYKQVFKTKVEKLKKYGL